MFQCPICYAPFNSVEACHDHMKTAHGIGQEAPEIEAEEAPEEDIPETEEDIPEEVTPKGKKGAK